MDRTNDPALLTPADGPADPPSSRPRRGILGAQVFEYRFRPSLGLQRAVLPVEASRPVGAGTRLHWAFYADDDAALLPPWASLAVCVDVLFDDGSRLGDGVAGLGPAIDRYGFEVTAPAQFRARWSMPEQWNADTVGLGPWAGRRVVAIECLLGDSSLAAVPGEATGYIEVAFEDCLRTGTPSPAEGVDTRRGSHAGPRFSRGNTVPAVAVPHGFAMVVPATDATDFRWPYRPFVSDDREGRRLEAFQLCHQPSPWIGDFGVLQVMPFDGRPFSDHAARRRHVRPAGETAQPHRYLAELAGGLRVEATATSRVAAFTVRGRGHLGFVVDQLDDRGDLRIVHAADGRALLSGWIAEPENARWGNAPRTYFVAETGGPAQFGRLTDAGRERTAGFVAAADELELRIATSFLGIEQARRSLRQEAPWEIAFASLLAAGRDAWDAVCSLVAVPAPADPRFELAHEELAGTIAGALYRLHLYPNDAAENTGTTESPTWHYADVFTASGPHGAERTGCPVVAGRLFVNNGYWDTYRTVWPLLCLLDPDGTGPLLDGQLEQVRRGGWTARWSAPGYVDSMVGTSSDQMYADAAAWGVGGFDRRLAFDSGWRNACEPSPDSRVGRAGVNRSRFTGFVSNETAEGLSWTVEAAISDAALARFARLQAQIAAEPARWGAFARYLTNRSHSWEALFDSTSGFLRGRGPDGGFAAGTFDPADWGGDYTETNAWGMSASAVHDGVRLAALHGGGAGLRAHLDRLFAEPETATSPGHYPAIIHEQREARAVRAGMCALSNQPAHHIPFMYLSSDQPWRAGEVARELAGRLFTGGHIGQGYPGDEDNGELSGWWLWALLGLYPLQPGSGELVIGSPLTDDVAVRRRNGRSLRVRSTRTSTGQHLIAARLNGQPLVRPVVPVGAFAGDVVLDLDFGPHPAAAALWQPHPTAATSWRPDLTSPSRGVGAAGVVFEAAFDDGASGSAVGLDVGEWVGQRFDEPQRVTDVTVTVRDGATGDAFEIECSNDGRTWAAVPTTHREDLPPNRTTPFALAETPRARWWRLRARRRLHLCQLELFELAADPS